MGEETVLVTGGSGYVGSWVIVELLRRGYQVRTTVRDLARADAVRAAVATAVDPAQRLSFVAANLLRDDGWAAAAEGSDYVLHVASPMPTGEYRGQDVITPAREGTRRVLEAAYHAGVKRVVMTSSTTTVMPTDPQAVADETVWSDLPDKPAYIYPRSKTLAERDAWALADTWNGAMELATVLPAQIQGPVLSTDFSASVDLIRMLLTGKMPALPRIGWGIVDVRDLAALHVQAMTAPNAAGERFIATGEFLWLSDVARILREHLGARASKVPNPKRTLPNAVVRLGALVNAEMAQLAPSLGVRTNLTAAKAQRMLGWRTRPAAESIIDAATSLIERDLA